MPTDYDIALLLQAQYDGKPVFDMARNTNGVDWAIKGFGDCSAIFLEGTHSLPDAARDFNFPMRTVAGIGGVHAGFYDGLPETLMAAIPYLPKDKLIKVCGHSLGAGEAHILTAMLAKAGYRALETIAFGSPLPGDIGLAATLAPFENRSYWNYCDFFNHDIVGSVPLYLPAEPFIAPRQRILIHEAPAILDPWGMVAWHHLNPLYCEGVRKLCGQ